MRGSIYRLENMVDQKMVQWAFVGWAQKDSRLQGKVTVIGALLLAGLASGALIHAAGLFDRVPSARSFGFLVVFDAGLAVWLIVHRGQVTRLAGGALHTFDRQGAIVSKLSADRVENASRFAHSYMGWLAYDQVHLVGGATALRQGKSVYPIRNSALPEDVTLDLFRSDPPRRMETMR